MSIEIRINGALIEWFEVVNQGRPNWVPDGEVSDIRLYHIRRSGQPAGEVCHHREHGAVALAAHVLDEATP